MHQPQWTGGRVVEQAEELDGHWIDGDAQHQTLREEAASMMQGFQLN